MQLGPALWEEAWNKEKKAVKSFEPDQQVWLLNRDEPNPEKRYRPAIIERPLPGGNYQVKFADGSVGHAESDNLQDTSIDWPAVMNS